MEHTKETSNEEHRHILVDAVGRATFVALSLHSAGGLPAVRIDKSERIILNVRVALPLLWINRGAGSD